jgi:hypothetical protein
VPITGWTSPGWTGTISLYVELGLPSPGSGVALWDEAEWDTGTWGADAVWTDVSAYVRGITTNRAVARESNAYNAGTCSVLLDNADLRFTEENASGPFFGQIGSGVPLRIRAAITFPDATMAAWPIFVGRIDDWDDTYPNVGAASTVTVTASDVFEQLAAFDGFEQTPRGAGELAGVRIQRILDNAGHTGDRNIDTGTTTMQATTLAGNALTELKLTADSEGGALWVEADGTVTFAGRYGRIENPKSSSPQVTLDDSGTSGIIYSAPTFSSSRNQQRTMAAYARKGGTSQIAVDQVARAVSGDRQLRRTDLLNDTDPSVLSLAQRDVALRSTVERRVDGATVEPFVQTDAATVTTALRWLASLNLWHQARVIRRPTPALTIDRYVHVTGVSFEIVPAFTWRATLQFQSATVWNTVASSRWDTAEWDTAAWAW